MSIFLLAEKGKKQSFNFNQWSQKRSYTTYVCSFCGDWFNYAEKFFTFLSQASMAINQYIVQIATIPYNRITRPLPNGESGYSEIIHVNFAILIISRYL